MPRDTAFAVATAGEEPEAVANKLATVGCVLVKGAVNPERTRDLATFVYGELERFERWFQDEQGFTLSDRASLENFLGGDVSSSPRFAELPADLQHLVRGELPLEVRVAPELKSICEEDWLMRVLRRVLGEDRIRLHHPPSIRTSRKGGTHGLVPLHQDASYSPHLGAFATVWMPLCPIDAVSGGLEILPGSHETAPVPHETKSIWLETRVDLDGRALVPIFCEPGDVILFGPLLLHRSRANTGDRVRCSVDFRFFPASHQTSRRYFDIEARRVVNPAEPGPALISSVPSRLGWPDSCSNRDRVIEHLRRFSILSPWDGGKYGGTGIPVGLEKVC